MKNLFIPCVLMILVLVMGGCQKKLIENPVSKLTPAFFSTAQGFQAGLDAAYAGNRRLWGNESMSTLTVPGTDEFTSGVDGNNDINKYANNFTATNGYVSGVWNPIYTFINTCNGLIDNADNTAGIDSASLNKMVGEARFLRANYYFLLVQLWGDVTLNEHFQNEASTSASRQPMADVYDLIITDLKSAIAVLPASPMQNGVLPGKATAAAARHLLAKVYLTRGYSKAKQSDDFASALHMAKSLIDDAPGIGMELLQDFGQVYAPGNEQNSEVLWSVQHTASTAYNGGFGSTDNSLCYFFLMKYDQQPGLSRTIQYGRPFSRFMPTHWLTDTCFQERVNDQRYGKTFQTLWLSNDAAKIPKDASGNPKYALGDTAVYLPGVDVTDAQISSTRYQIVPPRKYTTVVYPSLIKYDDPNRPDVSAASIRPIIVYRLAETYLIAAEAAFNMGQSSAAAQYINKVRERAAFPDGNPAKMDIAASDLTLDFILDERSRELCGENMRWMDLVRTHTLIKRVKLHNPDAAPNIKDFDTLRPIPQSLIDAVITGPEYPQNPGW